MTVADPPAGVRQSVPPPPGQASRARKRRLPTSLLSKISPARRVALVVVGLFEAFEAVLLWRKGIEHGDWAPVLLGLVVLILLLAFELAEHAATKRDQE